MAGRRPWQPETWRDETARQDRRWLVTEIDGAVAAVGGVAVSRDEAEVLVLVVAPRVRRRGIGARLLRRLRHAAAVAGASEVLLEVRETNAPALALYGREGFVEIGRRSRYYPDGTGAVVLRGPARPPGAASASA